MTDLRKLAQAADEAERRFKAANAGMLPSEFPVFDCIARDIAASKFHDALEAAYRSGSLIPRSEYERVLALLADAREASAPIVALANDAEEDPFHDADVLLVSLGTARNLRATLSRIDDALAAEPEAKS